MTTVVSVASLVFLVSTVVGIGVTGLCWRFADRPGVSALGVATGAIALFGVVAWVEYLVGLSEWFLLFAVEDFMIAVMPPALLVFVLRYTGRDELLTRPVLVLVLLEPIGTFLLTVTNSWHHLVYTAGDSPGLLYLVPLVTRYGILAAATFLLLRSLYTSKHQYRGQVIALTVGLLIPTLVNVAFLLYVNLGWTFFRTLPSIPGDAINAAGFTVGLAAVAAGANRTQLLDLIPATREVARDELIERMDDGVITLDERRRIVDINPSGEAIVGREAPDVIGDPIADAFPPVVPLLDRAGPVYEEIACEMGDEVAHYGVQITPLSTGDGGVSGAGSGWLVDLRDVTERRRRRQELERYETIVEVLGEMVYAVDRNGDLTFVNSAAESMIGRPAGQLLGTNVDEFIDETTRERSHETVRSLLADEDRSATTIEGRLVTADGSRRPVELSIAMLPTDDGESRGTAGVIRDVSEREQRKRRLQVLNRVLRHNLRNEMTVVKGAIEHVRERIDDPGLVEWLDTAIDQADDLESVGGRARDIEEAIESTARDPHPIDVVSTIRTVVARHQERYPHATIETDCPDEATVLADENLERVLANLVENAVEHHDRDHPRVWVSVPEPDDGDDLITIRVADDGPGIPEDERRIVTGDEEITALRHGSGLGLWMVTLVTETLGGEVEIDCRNGDDERGTVVSVRLPRR